MLAPRARAAHIRRMAEGNDRSWTDKAAVAAGAAIGSAAIAAAVLYVRNRKERTPVSPPPHPEDAPETD
jgi:Na+/H+-translocating membrane pyrophosphatase